ncbi:MAG: hypothetical protein GX122_06760 [Candidatus Cloacimonetes bacterium]|nr:type I-E CRISPR-associated protein Cse2/CasB [Candidatus Cloacimonadota bacterium]NLO12099.1 hypothetical protein [Candidatus Cloacimonadota bacterium]
MISTPAFIESLGLLKEGDLNILRQHRGSRLDESLDGFDLFTSLWWPLRRISPRAPRREVAWLIAKLFAEYRFEQVVDQSIPSMLGSICRRLKSQEEKQLMIRKFELLLATDLDLLEHHLAAKMKIIKDHKYSELDWVKLTDDLSIWDRQRIRQEWVRSFITTYERKKQEDKDVD